jgi:hypothetical protein
LRSTIWEKHDRWLPFAVRSRNPVRRAGLEAVSSLG